MIAEHTSEAQDGYFNKRMEELGVTAENNVIEVFNPEAEPPMSKVAKLRIFHYDQHGNITIRYWRIDGQLITYYTDAKNPKTVEYKTKRLRNPLGDMKYQMPKGHKPWPWFHPKTVKAYKGQEKIETLYLTEGVFKSWTAGQHGLHVVGLSSITHYRGADGELHQDIGRLIEQCQVDNLVILWDGDCLNVSNKDVQRREEATRRPFGFFSSAKNIRKLALRIRYEKTRSNPRIWFMYNKSNTLEGEPKGLDDMLIAAEQQDKIKPVLRDIKNLDGKNQLFFYRLEITSTTDLLFRHFLLHKEDASKFYQRHHAVIGDKEFYFRKHLYHYSDSENELKMLQPAWAKSIYWVGDEFFEEIRMPSAKEGVQELQLVHRKKETLTARFGRDFIKYLKYYHGFVNVPEHFKYERIIEMEDKEFFNKYFPFPHVPEEGKWPNIEKFLKHIFGEQPIEHPKTGEQIPNWHLGLDYLQLLLLKPTQQLPILVLFSRENQTGKSTFGELCYKMLGDNVIFIGNSDLQSDFNEPYAGRLLAICEETLLERRRDAERIKNMSTATRMTINPKGQKQYVIDFFCKFQFYSNNPRMVYVTRHDDRYWILKVKAIPKDQLDPGLKERMWAEIPAFVNYLRDRKMRTKNESRMWFNPTLLRTEIFLDTVQLNEPQQATDLRSIIGDWFYELGEDCKTIEMPMKNIRDEFFNKSTGLKWIEEILKDYLNVTHLKDEEGNQVFKRGHYDKVIFNEFANDGDGELQMKRIKWRGRPYLFRREDFIEDGVQIQDTAVNGKPGPLDKPMNAPEEDVPW
jgi:hypothetical protein